MALRDDEQRRLAEIERGLAEDDPKLAHRLSELGADRLPRQILAFIGMMTSFVAGLAVIGFGAKVGMWPLSVLGVVLVVVVPATTTWRVWLREWR